MGTVMAAEMVESFIFGVLTGSNWTVVFDLGRAYSR